MTKTTGPRQVATSTAGQAIEQTHDTQLPPHGQPRAELSEIRVRSLLTLLDGSDFAQAIMPWGKPGPIALPREAADRQDLVRAHLAGTAATVWFVPSSKPPTRIRVDRVVLGALCPQADCLCRWIAFDLDAAGAHGAGGLVNPAHAARCIVERSESAGLGTGLFVASSKSGAGRHVWLLLPRPTPLLDACVAVAAIAAQAFLIANRDADDGDGPHAFRCGNGTLAEPGRPGAFELVPRSELGPVLGWSLTLPAAGAFRERGGGIILDPFTQQPQDLTCVPQADPRPWEVFVRESSQWAARCRVAPTLSPHRMRAKDGDDPLHKLHPKTQEMLAGKTPVGERNTSLFAATCNLLGVGLPDHEAESLAMQGALACGLLEREARSTIHSAIQHKKGSP